MSVLGRRNGGREEHSTNESAEASEAKDPGSAGSSAFPSLRRVRHTMSACVDGFEDEGGDDGHLTASKESWARQFRGKTPKREGKGRGRTKN